MSQKRTAIKLDERIKAEERRTKRTNYLLISVSLIFGISWLPLNILNIISDVYYPFQDTSTFRIVFACCHMVGMSSACFNPLLYGWLNDNFQKEFKEIFALITGKLSSCCSVKGSIISGRTSISLEGRIETTVVYGESHDKESNHLQHMHHKSSDTDHNTGNCNTNSDTSNGNGSAAKKSLVVKQV